MLRNTIIFGLLIGVCAVVPVAFQANPDALKEIIHSTRAQNEAGEINTLQVARPAGMTAGTGRLVKIIADNRGHYLGEFKINGRKVDAMIDTGATAVAMNVSAARRLGVTVTLSDMKNVVNTANGKAKATVVQIDRIEIGRISVDNVPALVLEDEALANVLIGMTFLSKLKKFESDGSVMQLVQ